MAQEAPETTPRRPKRPPRRPQDGPRGPQEAPKGSLNRLPRRPRGAQDGPRRRQDPTRAPRRPHRSARQPQNGPGRPRKSPFRRHILRPSGRCSKRRHEERCAGTVAELAASSWLSFMKITPRILRYSHPPPCLEALSGLPASPFEFSTLNVVNMFSEPQTPNSRNIRALPKFVARLFQRLQESGWNPTSPLGRERFSSHHLPFFQPPSPPSGKGLSLFPINKHPLPQATGCQPETMPTP